MAILTPNKEREKRAAARSCGPCSLCCSVLRVDELEKPAGKNCRHQLGVRVGDPDDRATSTATLTSTGDDSPLNQISPVAGGCGIYHDRPSICRAYQCLWRQGGLEEDERPDETGGIVDLETIGIGLRLGIRMRSIEAFEDSPKLQAIAERYRSEMSIRITDSQDVTNPDRPFRVLLPEGIEHRVFGERIGVYQDGVQTEEKSLAWAERFGLRIMIWWRGRTLP